MPFLALETGIQAVAVILRHSITFAPFSSGAKDWNVMAGEGLGRSARGWADRVRDACRIRPVFHLWRGMGHALQKDMCFIL